MHVALQADRTWWVAPLHLLSESLPADRQAFTCATFFLPLWLGPCGLWLLMWSWLGFDGFPSLPQPFQRRVKAQLLRRDRQIWVAPMFVCLIQVLFVCSDFVCLLPCLFVCSLVCLFALCNVDFQQSYKTWVPMAPCAAFETSVFSIVHYLASLP